VCAAQEGVIPFDSKRLTPCVRKAVVAGGKGRELVTMFVDWKLRSSKKYESQKTVSQFNLFFLNDGNSCNSQ
jgi:hypothetical protein